MLRFALAFVVLLGTVSGHGQELLLKHFGVGQGLPSSTVYRLFVDRSGFLWLSTAVGVYRYDGHRFDQIGRDTDLDHLVLHHIFQVSKDTLWFAATNGRLFRWDGAVVREFDGLRDALRESTVDPRVITMVSAGKGGVFIGLPGGIGKGHIDQAGGLTWLPAAANGTHIESHGREVLMYHYEDGTNVKQTQAIHLHKGGAVRSHPPGHLTVGAGRQRNTVVTLRDGRSLLCIGRLVVQVMDTSLSPFFTGDRTILRCTELVSGEVFVVFEDGTTRILTGQGLPSTRSIHVPRPWRVSDVIVDRQGGMWISTMGHGVYYAPSLECSRPGPLGPIDAERVTDLLVDKDSITWLGTGQGVVLAIDAHDRQVGAWVLESLTNGYEIRGFGTDERGVMHATNGYGILRFEPGGVNVILPKDMNSWFGSRLLPLPGNKALVLGSHGLAEVALEHGGAAKWMRPGERFRGGAVGAGDTLWLWSNEGCRWYAHGTVGEHRPNEPLLQGAIADRVLMAGATWYASNRHGLVREDTDGLLQVVDLNTVRPLKITCLASMGDTVLLIGSATGIHRFYPDRPDRPVRTIDRNWGLPSEVVVRLGFDGRQVRALTEQGLVNILPSAFDRQAAQEPLLLLGATTNNDLVVVDGAELDHMQNMLDVRFALLNFRDHGQQRIRYKLLGDERYKLHLGAPEVRLAGLAPGSYTMLVSGLRSDGTWTPDLSFSWTIAPAWWRTWWATTLMLVLVAVLLSLLVAWSQAQRVRRRELEDRVAVHHHEALLGLMDPHFLFNSLNSVQSFIAQNDTDRSLRYMGRFAGLMRGWLRAGREREIPLLAEVDLLDQYCALEALRNQPPFVYTIHVGDLPAHELLVPAYLIQPHVENAIRHGLRALQDRPGKLDILFEREGGALRCTITDNGIGREEARRLRTADAHPSEALRIQDERVKALNQLSRQRGIRIHIEDLHDNTQRPRGTRVHIQLPWKT